VSLQAKIFGDLVDRWTCSSNLHNPKNSVISLIILSPVICNIHVFPCIASRTVVPYLCLGTAASTAGARVRMLEPLIQLSVQNNVDSPSPTTKAVAALNRSRTGPSPPSGSAFQEQVWWTRCSHGHLRRRAMPIRRRSTTPKPPRLRGLQHISQATLHSPQRPMPPPPRWNPSSACQYSIHCMAQGNRHRAIDMCTGISDRVLLTKVVLPAMFHRFPFQRGGCG